MLTKFGDDSGQAIAVAEDFEPSMIANESHVNVKHLASATDPRSYFPAHEYGLKSPVDAACPAVCP